jgi:hypothetical protein
MYHGSWMDDAWFTNKHTLTSIWFTQTAQGKTKQNELAGEEETQASMAGVSVG